MVANIIFQAGQVLSAEQLNALEGTIPQNLIDGSVLNLALAFASTPNTGLYRRSDNGALDFVDNGVAVLELNSGGTYNATIYGTLNVTGNITSGGLPIGGNTSIQVADGTNNETGITEIIFSSGATVSSGGTGVASIAIGGLPTTTSGQIIIGQSSGPATAQTLSGDATISSSGVLSVTSLNNGANPIGTTGATIPLNNSNKTDSGNNTFSGTNTFSGIVTYGSGTVQQTRVVIAAGSVTVGTTDYIVIINKGTGAATTVNLPSSPTTGRVYVIKDGKGDANTNNITVTPAAGNIDGQGTLVIDVAYGSAQICYNGTQWNVVANSINLADTSVNLGSSVSGTTTLNMNNGNYFYGTVTGNFTLAVSNPLPSGSVTEFNVELVNGGAHTPTYMSGTKWGGAAQPTLTTSGTDILSFFSRDGGTTWRGFASALNSA